MGKNVPSPAAPAAAQAAAAHEALPAGAALLLLRQQLSGLGEPGGASLQPQSKWCREKVGMGGQSWHRASRTHREGPQTGLTGTPRPVETWPQSPVPLHPGSCAWDLAPQRNGKCCRSQEQADGSSAPSPTPRGLSGDPAQQDMSWATPPVPSAQ